MASIKKLSDAANTLVNSKNVSSVEVLKIETECKKQLTSINEKLQVCINMFNTVIQDICKTLIKSFPNDPTITTYSEVVNEIINDSPVEPVSLFIIYIYKDAHYRKSIIEGNDSFFLDNDHHHMTGGDSNKVATMFQFKSCWNNFDEMQKNYIKNATKMLLNISEKYIIQKDDGNQLANIMAKFAKVQTC